jgi:hypothetical protein
LTSSRDAACSELYLDRVNPGADFGETTYP